MSASYLSPRLLASADRLDGFECRTDQQTLWLRKHARQDHARGGTTRMFVVTEASSSDVVAYYAWCMASITPAQPVALLARLGVDLHHEGRGLGGALLADVISRTAQIGSEVGCRGLLVHSESASARAFYLHVIPEFEPSPTDPLHLVLLMKDILRTLCQRKR
ncbi:N-acetyltransferase [Synechococcus sp. ATX 2A4]|uniref:GNAT family N-acetyltransferase n=1 Tax=Synechococcus sp. ATX 2A4 TaxID=2823727 RepID=UPI0020CE9342|nr:GNAT family N-acetyltransferase [Synechococcus sp. ATX 2A4]MCP9883518.1 N-acetyltransferase [Synechococcus sp. ATX 2A4]